MLHFVRAMVIIDRALMKFEGWEYKFEDGLHHACLVRPGWRAEIWLRPEASDYHRTPISDFDSFRNACRSSTRWYKFNLWVDCDGKVLSATRRGNELRGVQLKRGRWETMYFGLSSPKSKKSPYYCDFSPF